jgi:hypothetical protein
MFTKKHVLLLLSAVLTLSVASKAQSEQPTDGKAIKYRRSSLHLILSESDNFPMKDTVVASYRKAPFPDKYNNHSVDVNTFVPSEYLLTDAERDSLGIKKAGAGADLAADLTMGISDPLADDMPFMLQKFMKDKKVAHKMVANWFKRDPQDGSFDMSMIAERGSYNASELDVATARGSARGLASVADAGVELIQNTFVVVNRLNFVSNEIPARILRDAAKLAASKIPSAIGQELAMTAADLAYEKAKEGYSVFATSYLFQLEWNDSTEAVFYNDYWVNKGDASAAARAEAFFNNDLFKMKYIGSEKSKALVTFSLKEQRSEIDYIEEATVRAVDNVYGKLQKAYEVFKPKVPLLTGEPVTAKIGMKEGLEGGEKFEVLEQTVDVATGATKYVRVGTITVDKKKIWDNRYVAGSTPPPAAAEATAEVAPVEAAPAEGAEADKKDKKKKGKEEASSDPNLDRTYFKGGKNLYAGMLIRQIK